MNRVFLRTSVLGFVSALALTGLGGCSDALTTLKQADVDGTAPLSPEEAMRADRARVDTIISTAQDLVAGKGGIVENVIAANPKLTISIVDPLTMGRPEDNRPPLDARPGAHAYLTKHELEAQKALPDIPIGEGTPAARPVNAPAPPVQTVSLTSTVPSNGRMIQVGSFSTRQGAEAAWTRLASLYDGIDRLAPVYETVNANGRTLVRLRIGPVQNEIQARALCEALGVTDNWCTKAG